MEAFEILLCPWDLWPCTLVWHFCHFYVMLGTCFILLIWKLVAVDFGKFSYIAALKIRSLPLSKSLTGRTVDLLGWSSEPSVYASVPVLLSSVLLWGLPSPPCFGETSCGNKGLWTTGLTASILTRQYLQVCSLALFSSFWRGSSRPCRWEHRLAISVPEVPWGADVSVFLCCCCGFSYCGKRNTE